VDTIEQFTPFNSCHSVCMSRLLLKQSGTPLFAQLQVVQEVVNPDAKIEFRENTADDPSRRKPDITKVRCCGN
jgi:hypothetical protein